MGGLSIVMDDALQRVLSESALQKTPEEAFNSIIGEMCRSLGATTFCVSLVENDQFARLWMSGAKICLSEGVYHLARGTVLGHLQTSGDSSPWLHIEADNVYEASVLESSSLLVFPLRVMGVLYGAITFDYQRELGIATSRRLQCMSLGLSAVLAGYTAKSKQAEDEYSKQQFQELAVSIEAMGRQANLSNLVHYATQVFQQNLRLQSSRILLLDGESLRSICENESPRFELPIPKEWTNPCGPPAVLLLDSMIDRRTQLLPLVQESKLLGAVQVVSRGSERLNPSYDRVLDIMLSSLASCLKKQQNYEEALEMRAEAESANKAKTAFIANISHEIRTPLNSIVGLSSILRERCQSPVDLECLETIQRSSEILESVIDDLLDLSRMEGGHVRLSPSEVKLPELVEECLEIVRPDADRKGLSIVYGVSNRVAEKVLVDKVRLTQVLLNLLANAVKFTQEGHVSLQLDYCASTGETCIYVADSGIGIPHRAMDRIFTPFYRVSDLLSENRGGTGLGLAIASQLVELMSGRIEVKSDLGYGTTFTVRLPLAPVRASNTAERGTAAMASKYQKIEDHILFVDDNELNRLTGRTLLSSFCTHLTIAASGLEAIDIVKAQSPPIVLMDISMPEIDGLEATRRIRELPVTQPFIIAVSGHILDVFKERAAEAGVNDFLEKPYSIDQLRRALEAASSIIRGKLRVQPHFDRDSRESAFSSDTER